MQTTQNQTRYFALIAGVVYLLVGILGFIPALVAPPPTRAPSIALDAGYGMLFGLFAVNSLHNLIHIVFGIWGLVAYRRFEPSRTFARSLAIVFGVLTVFGLFPGLNTVFGLVPVFGHDVWLHLITALVAAYFGWARAGVPSGMMRPQT